MKIDFLARYNEVAQALKPQNTLAQQTGQGFSQMIGDLMPNKQTPENTVKIEDLEESLFLNPEESPRASLRQSGPELLMPEAPLQEIEEAPTDSQSVKTPSLLGAERISERPTAMSLADVEEVVMSFAPKLGVDPALTLAVAEAESSFNPSAVSSDGHESKGLFQILDSTAKTVIAREGLADDFDPFNPNKNAEVGIHYLRYLHDLFSSSTELPSGDQTIPAANSSSLAKLAVAAYNAGEGRVASAQARAARDGNDPSSYEQIADYLPDITQKYVDRVMRMRSGYEARFIG